MSLFGDLFHITFKYLLDITLGHLPPPRNDERDPLQILQRGTLGAPLCPQVLRHRALPWDQVPGAEVLSPEDRWMGSTLCGCIWGRFQTGWMEHCEIEVMMDGLRLFDVICGL